MLNAGTPNLAWLANLSSGILPGNMALPAPLRGPMTLPASFAPTAFPAFPQSASAMPSQSNPLNLAGEMGLMMGNNFNNLMNVLGQPGLGGVTNTNFSGGLATLNSAVTGKPQQQRPDESFLGLRFANAETSMFIYTLKAADAYGNKDGQISEQEMKDLYNRVSKQTNNTNYLSANQQMQALSLALGLYQRVSKSKEGNPVNHSFFNTANLEKAVRDISWRDGSLFTVSFIDLENVAQESSPRDRNPVAASKGDFLTELLQTMFPQRFGMPSAPQPQPIPTPPPPTFPTFPVFPPTWPSFPVQPPQSNPQWPVPIPPQQVPSWPPTQPIPQPPPQNPGGGRTDPES